MHPVFVVFRKELKDSLRDRRSIASAVLFSLFGPVLLGFVITMTAEKQLGQRDLNIHVTGEAYAHDLSQYLKQRKVNFVESDQEASVRLEIPEDYAQRFNAGQPVRLKLYVDRSRSDQARDAQRLSGYIQAYSAELGQLRLMLRGVVASVANPVLVELKDESSPQGRSVFILGGLVVFFLLASFIGSMAVSIDISAGERERNSLEILMAQPVSANTIFTGKWLVAALFGAISTAIILVVSKLVFLKVPLSKIGFIWGLGWSDLIVILFALLSVSGLAAALQLVVAMWAKSFKEASSYLSMLSFLPAGVAMAVFAMELEAQNWMYAVPLLGHQQFLLSMVRAESVGVFNVSLLTFNTAIVVALLLFAGGKMLTREKIIFGQSD